MPEIANFITEAVVNTTPHEGTREGKHELLVSAAFQDVSEKECLLNSDEEDLEEKSHFIEDCPRPHISARVSIQGRFSDTFQALIDSGSEINVMSQEIAKDFEKRSVDIEEAGDKPLVLVTANGSQTRKIQEDFGFTS